MTGKEFVDKVFVNIISRLSLQSTSDPETICFHHLVSRLVVHVFFMCALFTFYHVAQRASFQPITNSRYHPS